MKPGGPGGPGSPGRPSSPGIPSLPASPCTLSRYLARPRPAHLVPLQPRPAPRPRLAPLPALPLGPRGARTARLAPRPRGSGEAGLAGEPHLQQEVTRSHRHHGSAHLASLPLGQDLGQPHDHALHQALVTAALRPAPQHHLGLGEAVLRAGDEGGAGRAGGALGTRGASDGLAGRALDQARSRYQSLLDTRYCLPGVPWGRAPLCAHGLCQPENKWIISRHGNYLLRRISNPADCSDRHDVVAVHEADHLRLLRLLLVADRGLVLAVPGRLVGSVADLQLLATDNML